MILGEFLELVVVADGSLGGARAARHCTIATIPEFSRSMIAAVRAPARQSALRRVADIQPRPGRFSPYLQPHARMRMHACGVARQELAAVVLADMTSVNIRLRAAELLAFPAGADSAFMPTYKLRRAGAYRCPRRLGIPPPPGGHFTQEALPFGGRARSLEKIENKKRTPPPSQNPMARFTNRTPQHDIARQ
jgi:hypothetical protein